MAGVSAIGPSGWSESPEPSERTLGEAGRAYATGHRLTNLRGEPQLVMGSAGHIGEAGPFLLGKAEEGESVTGEVGGLAGQSSAGSPLG